VLVGRVVDVLALDGHLVTRHVIRGHDVWLASGWMGFLANGCVSCQLQGCDWLATHKCLRRPNRIELGGYADALDAKWTGAESQV